MKHFLITTLFCLGACLGAKAQPPARSGKPAAVNIIFDTDMGPDYDDVGAIALLHALADSGQATILATVASSKYPRVVPVLSVLNTYFGRPDIPIGVPKGQAVTDADKQHWSDTLVARYPHKLKTNDQAPDAIALYRQVLAAQPDRSVTVVTVGFLTNLDELLASPADRYSKFTGKQLVEQKVKGLVCMAGKFPEGREFNVFKDAAASKRVYDNWPTEIVFSGFEIGQKIKTGLPLVQNKNIRNSPIKDVFRISLPLDPEDKGGRMSWDQTAVLVAIKGAGPYYTTRPGRFVTLPDGANRWDAAGKGHQYLVEKMPVPQVTRLINQYMMHQPVKKARQ
jgi:inosine-uridine nucleoside N-ribohydrolase